MIPTQSVEPDPVPRMVVPWKGLLGLLAATATLLVGWGQTPAGADPVVPPSVTGQVVGGHPISSAATGWFAQVWAGGMLCGGTFIDSRHVLTAAHCVAGRAPNSVRVLRNPVRLLSGLPGAARARTISVHPHYRPNAVINDAAVIALAVPSPGPSLPLNSDGRIPALGQVGKIYGFGTVANGGALAPRLLSAQVRSLQRNGRCGSHGASYNSATMVCASGDDRADSCNGDSGGPMTATGYDGVVRVVGITSWGRGCAAQSFPGVYTRVSAVSAWASWVARKT